MDQPPSQSMPAMLSQAQPLRDYGHATDDGVARIQGDPARQPV